MPPKKKSTPSIPDFFDNALDADTDHILGKLQQQPCDVNQFQEMVKACLSSVIQLLERQYARYFRLGITEELKKQTESARSHNIDSEEVMGMFSAAQQRAPNATLDFLSSKNCVTFMTIVVCSVCPIPGFARFLS